MNIAKCFIFLGVVFILVGVLVWLSPHIPGVGRLGRLPGDIRHQGKNVSFYFPWVTCLLLTCLLTLLFQLFRGIRK